MTIIADIFPILQTPKNVVKQIFKKSPFRQPFQKQHVKGDQTIFEIGTAPPLPYLLTIVKATELEKTSISDMKSPKTVSSHIDCQ